MTRALSENAALAERVIIAELTGVKNVGRNKTGRTRRRPTTAAARPSPILMTSRASTVRKKR